MAHDARAIIVGGGPVGLAVAALLGQTGWDAIVLEARREPTPITESRAITWMPEGLLLADELGVTDELRTQASVRTRHEFRRRPTGPALLTVPFDLLRHRLTGRTDTAAAFSRYERRQREVSTSVQRGNATTFRNLAVRSVAVGAIRGAALRGLGHSSVIGQRLAASEGLVGMAPPAGSYGDDMQSPVRRRRPR